jgi:divalent metal cation (Fe/Co/Zn/Cd) transporter
LNTLRFITQFTLSPYLQIYATVKSGSIAIAASTLDSLLDLMAGGILWFTHLSMKSINVYKYPIGKLRVQPVGIIIFAAVMATLGMFAPCWKRSFVENQVMSLLVCL